MPDSYLEPALDSIDYFYARMFRNWPGAVTQSAGGVTISYSGDTRLTGANHLWLHAPNVLTARVLDAAARFFRPFHASWSVVYTDSYMPYAADLLDDLHFHVRWHSALMVLDHPPARLRAHPVARAIRVRTAAHVMDLRRVMTDSFGTDDSVNDRVARLDHLDAPDIAHYLIYEGSEPAACATVAMQNGIGGIWNVGTRYPFRRQRYATTIMLALLDDLRMCGCPASMLMASPAGRPLYERLGYRQIGTTYYMGPPYTHV